MLISEVQRDYARQVSGKAVKLDLDSKKSPDNNWLIYLSGDNKHCV